MKFNNKVYCIVTHQLVIDVLVEKKILSSILSSFYKDLVYEKKDLVLCLDIKDYENNFLDLDKDLVSFVSLIGLRKVGYIVGENEKIFVKECVYIGTNMFINWFMSSGTSRMLDLTDIFLEKEFVIDVIIKVELDELIEKNYKDYVI